MFSPARAGGQAVALSLLLAACGGGGGDGGTPPPPVFGGPSNDDRAAAATATATSTTNVCVGIQPFYWEIGDKTAKLASGSVGGGYTQSSSMNIASASKWLYAAYVAQKRTGVLSDDDIKYLTFRSGYTNFTTCLQGQTVDGCVNYLSNGNYDPSTDGFFYYGGGHMQKHASLEGLGALDNAGLAAEIRAQIGADIGLSYSQPQLAGGGVSTAADYAVFLRKLLAGSLKMSDLLGTSAVCTNPSDASCTTAKSAPVPASLSWHYSIGHWVEDDPAVGDGAFSSPGAFGFYPWIDAGRSYYGVVARHSLTTQAWYESAQCGALIRKAWATATAQ